MIFRLTAGYHEREAVKAHGAKFNFAGKYWYYEGDELPEGLKKWYREDGSSGKALQEKGIVVGEQAFLTVTKVNQMIADKYRFIQEFEHILVQGEVTNYGGHHGAHYYFDIKDGQSQLPCRLWEPTANRVLKFELKKGQLVGISGKLEFYEKVGTTQLIVGDICNLGEGDASLALLQLKKKLEAEGLFAPEHKKPIPAHPKKVGIITSKDGQAIKDICQKATERNPYVELVLYHVQVQGKNAIPTILKGIHVMDGMGMDTIIVGGGGGSDEELMVYNEEAIARAVYAAKTPIISAVGHEGHWTLIDYVSDLRVSTPTSAAQHAIPDILQDVERLRRLQREMSANMKNQVERRQALLRERHATLERYHPERKLKEQRARLSSAWDLLRWNLERVYQEKQLRLNGQWEQLKWSFQRVYSGKKHRYEMLVTSLNGLSPTAKLVKGFGYISKENRPVTSVGEVTEGEELLIRIHDGEIDARVIDVRKGNI